MESRCGPDAPRGSRQRAHLGRAGARPRLRYRPRRRLPGRAWLDRDGGRRRQAGVDGAREIAACRRVRQLDPPDVTQLDALGLEDGFDFVLDRGCFDGLSNRERQRCAMRVTDRTGPGSRLLLFGFQPRRFGLGPRGVTAEDVQGRFGRSWDVVSVTPDTALHRLPPWLGNPRPTWYLLARTA